LKTKEKYFPILFVKIVKSLLAFKEFIDTMKWRRMNTHKINHKHGPPLEESHNATKFGGFVWLNG